MCSSTARLRPKWVCDASGLKVRGNAPLGWCSVSLVVCARGPEWAVVGLVWEQSILRDTAGVLRGAHARERGSKNNKTNILAGPMASQR
jgi:hypothetical protein